MFTGILFTDHVCTAAIQDGVVSGRVGVPPAVLCILRSTRQMIQGNRIALGVRVYSAGREIRQAGRPPYPKHAARYLHASVV